MAKKKTKVILFVILIIPILLVISYFIGLPIVEKIAKEKAISSLEESVGAQVDIDEIKIQPFKQKLIIKKLEITNPYKPLNNIISFEQTVLNLRLKDYWDSETVYLTQGLMSGTKVDLPKSSGKAGWVDEKKYPKKDEKSLQDRLSDIDLNSIKKDFRKNFNNDLKNTKFYQEYNQTYSRLKSKVDVEYKDKVKDIEADFKVLSKTKVNKNNLAEVIRKAQTLKKRFDGIKDEFKELKNLQSLYKKQGALLNKAQSQVIESFLSRQGFGDFQAVIQEQIQGLISSKSEVKAEATSSKSQLKPVKKLNKKRDDVLFFVENFIINGNAQNIDGQIKNFHNRHGEDFKDWIGGVKVKGLSLIHI